LILLLAVIGILARMTGVRWVYLAILLLCGYRSLMTNFIYGQYYIFLLFLMTLTLDSFARDRDGLSGFLSGAASVLKLYPGPLVVYFAVKRAWAGVFGMVAGAACVGGVALLLFGWSGIAYYLTHVFPRTLEGNSVDPYNLLTATPNMLLHRLFLREAELNPHPVFEAPWLFFFVRTAMQLGLVVFAALGVVWKADPDRRRDLAWFLILLVLISTSTATHTYILLFAPVAVLFDVESLSSSGAIPENMDAATAVLRGGLPLSACHRNAMGDGRTGGGCPHLGNGRAASPEGLPSRTSAPLPGTRGRARRCVFRLSGCDALRHLLPEHVLSLRARGIRASLASRRATRHV
jgi:hypothetical protein